MKGKNMRYLCLYGVPLCTLLSLATVYAMEDDTGSLTTLATNVSPASSVEATPPEDFATDPETAQSYVQQRCHTIRTWIEQERMANLAASIQDDAEFTTYHRKRTVLEATEVAAASALVATGALALYNRVAPYITGFTVERFPQIVERLDQLTTQLPDSPYLAPVGIVSLSALIAGYYAKNRLARPSFDASTLAIIDHANTAQRHRLEALEQYIDFVDETERVKAADFSLVDKLLARKQAVINDILDQIDPLNDPEKYEKYAALTAEYAHLANLLKSIAPHEKVQKTKQKVKKEHTKNAFLGALGLSAVLANRAAPTTRAYTGSSAIDPVSTIALCASWLGVSSHYARNTLTDDFNTMLRKKLEITEAMMHERHLADIEETQLDIIAQDQGTTRELGQQVDLQTLELQTARENLLKAFKAHAQPATLQMQAEVLKAASTLLQHYCGQQATPASHV